MSPRVPFDPARFVAECRASRGEGDVLAALTQVMARALEDPQALMDSFGTGEGIRLGVLTSSADLTILQFETPVGFGFPPHDHKMPSVVGVYSGVEENVYFAREGTSLECRGRRLLTPGDLVAHDGEVIHSIANVADVPLGALHVYLGDFFHQSRSEWRGEPLGEYPYDLERLRRLIGSSGLKNPSAT